MKNIHILPTDKPSRLQKNRHNKLFFSKEPKFYSDCINQNTNITSDEEIKEGDYGIDIRDDKVFKCERILTNHYEFGVLQFQKSYCKKIILTTDQDLIKDDVQAIDDEFLEWFVKNPSCEEVETKLIEEIPSGFTFGMFGNDEPPTELVYKIIIPSEEPKQDLEKEMFELEEQLDIPSHLRWHNSKPKKETLEEAELRQLFRNRSNCYADADDVVQAMDENCFIETINEWQQERSYSEEEVEDFIYKVCGTVARLQGITLNGNHIDTAYKQFKKK